MAATLSTRKSPPCRHLKIPWDEAGLVAPNWKARKLMATCFVVFNGKTVGSVRKGLPSAGRRFRADGGLISPYMLGFYVCALGGELHSFRL